MSRGMRQRVFCHCAQASVPSAECDRCPADDGCDEGPWVDPPLYAEGKLAAMNLAELQAEHERQCDRQGALGDAEVINDQLVTGTEARIRLVDAEIARRKSEASD